MTIRGIAARPERNSQCLWISASCASVSPLADSSGRSTRTPFSNFAPARNRRRRGRAGTPVATPRPPRRHACPRGQDRRGEPLPLPGGRVDALVEGRAIRVRSAEVSDGQSGARTFPIVKRGADRRELRGLDLLRAAAPGLFDFPCVVLSVHRRRRLQRAGAVGDQLDHGDVHAREHPSGPAPEDMAHHPHVAMLVGSTTIANC
jgi:hypothetical protein